ncbi:MAG: hypothetical protein GEU92_14110 [Alphaproteobacteria bacterium]|nr:hypothetical protein [Alphaproteobacteria bacterium]
MNIYSVDPPGLRRRGAKGGRTAAALALAFLAVPGASAALAQSAPPTERPSGDKPASAGEGRSADEDPKWGASLDFEGKAGTRRHLGEADLFVPLLQDERTLLFANARFRFDDDSSREGNLGLGVRRMVGGGWNLGAYGYFDRRRSENDHYFNQATFGVEALGRDFDARANLYLPFGERIKTVDSLNTATLSGTSVVFRGGEERAIPGFDAEVGWRVPVFDADSPHEFRLYAGGYRFDDPAVEAVAGPRLRAELTAYDVPQLWHGARVTLGAEWQHDEPRGGQAFFSARLRIPLHSEARRSRHLTAQERRMTAPVVRDVDIVAQAGDFGAPETVTETASGQTLSVLSSDSTTGAALPGTVAAAGADSTVVLSGTFTTTAATVLQSGQTLMGAGSVAVRSPSGRTATLTTPAATINAAVPIVGTNATVTLASNTTLTGLNLTNSVGGGNAAIGVAGDNVTGITITNNAISSTTTGNGVIGMRLTGTVTGVVSDNTITATTVPGQTATAFATSGVGAKTLTVSGNTITATGGTTNNAVNVSNAIFNAGSTGNVLGGGACVDSGGNTGSISFTNGATCP